MLSALRADLAVNNDPLSRLVLTVYRFGRWASGRHGVERVAALAVYRVANTVVLRLLVGIDLPRQATVGPGLRLFHGGRGVAIHKGVRIGRDVTIYQNVAIGTWNRNDQVPTVGDGVTIGVGAAVLGPVTIGRRCRVGAHALVRRDMAPGEIAQAPDAEIVESRSS